MVSTVSVRDFPSHVGKVVKVKGWVYNRRSSGKVSFWIFRDGTRDCQIVIEKSKFPEDYKRYKKIAYETSVEVVGEVVKNPKAINGYELLAHEIKIFHEPAKEWPLQKKDHGIDYLLDRRHLWLRSRRPRAILKVRSVVMKAIEDWLHNEGFVRVDAPIFTPSVCEGTTTLFEVEYFDKKAYLSQSGQLYMEAAAAAFGKVYCFGPAFRAEKSKTRRHLTEFWMVEPEMAFITLEENMRVQEEMVSYAITQVLKECEAELEFLERDISKLEKIKPPFERLSYTEAVELLKKKGFDIEWGEDFGADEEAAISEEFEKPVFVHRYPAKSKAFYMEPDPENPDVVLCSDMLAPEGYGEIIGGGQRIGDVEKLNQKIREWGLDPESMKWYVELREYGGFPHGGFGLGIERFVAWITGTHHVRECIPFPRTIYRLYP